MVSEPVELHLVRGLGPCLYCGAEGPDTLGTPDAEPAVGSLVFCGVCAGVHLLDAQSEPCGDCGGDVPVLCKPGLAERLELLKRPDVQAVRDAHQLDQMEARMRRASAKEKPVQEVSGRKVRTRSGDRVSFTLKGPDAR